MAKERLGKWPRAKAGGPLRDKKVLDFKGEKRYI
jgi:hypothetical protein